jgi:hypothetical protein
MPAVLHLLTRADDARALSAIEREREDADTRVEIVLLPGATAPALPAGLTARRVPDDLSYDELLDLIFSSDQVIAW